MANLNNRIYPSIINHGFVYTSYISSTANNTVATVDIKKPLVFDGKIPPPKVFTLRPYRIKGSRCIDLADFNKKERHVFFMAHLSSLETDVEKIEFHTSWGATDATIFIRSSRGNVVIAFCAPVTCAREYWKTLKSDYGWRPE